MSSYIDEKIRIKRVMFFALLVSLLFFFFNLNRAVALFYIGIVGLLFSIVALSEKELFLLMSFLMPNLFMFKPLGSDSAILGYFFVLISIKTILVHFKRTVKINIFFVIHFVFAFFTCFLYSDWNLMITLIRFAFNFSIFTYLATLFSEKKDIKQVVKMYFAGIIAAILMGIIFRSIRGNLYNGYFAGVNCGRNYFGAVVTPTITIVMLYFLKRRTSFQEMILYGTTLILCMISIVLSGSRTSVLSLVVPILMCLLYSIRSVWRFNKNLIPLILLLVMFGIVIYVNYQDSLMYLVDRFNQDDVSTGNGRFDLWQFYVQQTIDNPLSFMLGNGSVYYDTSVEHNTIIQCFYQLGFIGLVSFLGIVQKAFRKINNGKKISIISTFPLLSVIIPYMGISGLYADQLSYLLILCALIIKDFSTTDTAQSLGDNILG